MSETDWILLGAAAVLIMCLIAVAFAVAARPRVPKPGRRPVRFRSR
jgi:hypothetical protein